ncbi:MAG: UDP-3-O-(3-hydroxymyristoyl)glucosamine N-acyltransferase [Candidatus Eisenbacteria bacterium]|nr:UDP-3-O-(3-hydroxymyristoyl)glucosamine N-acyltransferase [Candidatus Eisenbacteria bacterium]
MRRRVRATGSRLLSITLSELARRVGGDVVGDGSVVLERAAAIGEAREGDLTFLSNPRYEKYLATTAASAVVVDREHATPLPGRALLVAEDAYACFARAIEVLRPGEAMPDPGTDESAVVSDEASLGRGVAIGPNAVVMDGATIGDGVVVDAGAYVGRGVSIGRESIVHANVVLKARCSLGERVVVHSGTVIGTDGFGFALGEAGRDHQKVPQVGTVIVEDDVEIGSNVCIDRATLGETRIGRGTKIDNLVQIGHNVVVGEGAVIVAQVGISGSTRVGSRAVLAGQAGIVGHITIGDDAVVGAQSGVTRSIEPGAVVSGYPARDHRTSMRLLAGLQRLPELFRRVRALERRIGETEEE